MSLLFGYDPAKEVTSRAEPSEEKPSLMRRLSGLRTSKKKLKQTTQTANSNDNVENVSFVEQQKNEQVTKNAGHTPKSQKLQQMKDKVSLMVAKLTRKIEQFLFKLEEVYQHKVIYLML